MDRLIRDNPGAEERLRICELLCAQYDERIAVLEEKTDKLVLINAREEGASDAKVKRAQSFAIWMGALSTITAVATVVMNFLLRGR